MVRTGSSEPNERPVDRARATFDQRMRAVKTWWQSLDAPQRSYGGIDLTTDAPDPTQSNDISSGTGEALVASVTEELGRMRRDVDEHDAELVHALQRLAQSYERVVERLESDRRGRRMLAEAVLRLERRLTSPEIGNGSVAELPSGERVTGGWVSPAPEPDSPPPAVEHPAIDDSFPFKSEGANGTDHTTEVIVNSVPDRS